MWKTFCCFLWLILHVHVFTCSAVSCPKTDGKTWTFVPPLDHFCNRVGDDEDDFEAMAGKSWLLLLVRLFIHATVLV